MSLPASPHALVVAGHGLNCETETARAFEEAGAKARIVHTDDITAEIIRDAQILAIPGGFSYGDDTGAGNALASRIQGRWADHIPGLIARGGLVLGICNGCQVLASLGLVALGRDSVTLLPNRGGHYQARWVHLVVGRTASPWLADIKRLHVPVAHGEGQWMVAPGALAHLEAQGQVALRYSDEQGAPAGGAYPANPNGSVDDIAGLTDPSGQVLALMPHPERALFFHHLPDWTRRVQSGDAPPRYGDGIHLFRNAVRALQ